MFKKLGEWCLIVIPGILTAVFFGLLFVATEQFKAEQEANRYWTSECVKEYGIQNYENCESAVSNHQYPLTNGV